MLMNSIFRLLCAALLLCSLPLHASEIKTDEEIIYFHSSAWWDGEQQHWRLPIHGWIFESESDSLWRQGAMELLKLRLGLSNNSNNAEHLKSRGWSFLVDNEGSKDVSVMVNGSALPLPPSEANGHFQGEATLPATAIMKTGISPWIHLNTIMPEGDHRQFVADIQLVGPEGVSVISDIDDTIKDSHVLDHEELLKNTFLRDFRSISGMAELYQQWQKEGAVFHYVTGSPWQLYPALDGFIDAQGFPRGSFVMRHFRVADGSLIKFLGPSYDFKVSTIDELFRRYPQRHFLLVGDSGEKDPEVYGEIARRYPSQVKAIYIHNVTAEERETERFRIAFGDFPAERWRLFTDGYELAKSLEQEHTAESPLPCPSSQSCANQAR